MDDRQWVQRHLDTVGVDPWRRALRGAWVLTAARIGYDRRGIVGEDTTSAQYRDRQDRWLPASTLLALALWREARKGGLLVDDVPLAAGVGRWLGGERATELFVAPLPPDEDWEDLAECEADLIEPARSVVLHHTLSTIDAEAGLEDTDEGAPLPSLLLGDLVRAVEAAGLPQAPPPWRADVEHAAARISAARQPLALGYGTISDQDLLIARILHPALTAPADPPDLPTPPGVQGPTWIQRLRHLDDLTAALTASQGVTEARALPGPDRLVGQACAATTVVLNEILRPARELEREWARRPASMSVASWERQHMPPALRRQVRAAEELLGELAALMYDVLLTGAR